MNRSAIAVLSLGLALPVIAQDPRPKGLESHIGKDLRKLDEPAREEFQKQVYVLTGDKPEKDERRGHEPWWVKAFVGGKAGWVLLEAYPGYSVPDVSGVQVHVFDKSWKRLSKQAFPTGYRMFLKEVELVKDNPLQQDLLVAKVTSSGPFIVQGNEIRPAFEQGDYQRQYYALSGDQFVMVRLEDSKKKLVQNHYRWSFPPKGPAPPKRTREEWIRSLESANAVEQLSTLVWLSGTHLASTAERKQDHDQESVENAKLYEAVRGAAETKKLLNQLTESKNAWVQEYAKFALQVIRE